MSLSGVKTTTFVACSLSQIDNKRRMYCRMVQQAYHARSKAGGVEINVSSIETESTEPHSAIQTKSWIMENWRACLLLWQGLHLV